MTGLILMSQQHSSSLLNHSSSQASSTLDSGDAADDIIPAPPRSQALWVAVTKLVIVEFLVIAGTALLASTLYLFRNGTLTTWTLFDRYFAAAILLAAIVELTAITFDHFENSQWQSRHTFLFNGFVTVIAAFLLLHSTLFVLEIPVVPFLVWKGDHFSYPGAIFVFQFVTVECAVLALRAASYAWLHSSIAAGRVIARRVVLIGEYAGCAELAERLKATAIQDVGSFPFPVRQDQDGSRQVRALIEECRLLKPDDILILAEQHDLGRLSSLTASLSEVPAGIHVVPVAAAAFLASGRLVEFGNTVTMQVGRPPLSQRQRRIKRVFDIVIAALLLAITSPVFLLVAVAIKASSPSAPVLFRQARHGYNNETIMVFMFRTMGASEGAEPRVTRTGAILRWFGLQHLPKLFNVIRGEMSVVGPRPYATDINKEFEDKISVFSRRHRVKPGITGWAQVHGDNGGAALATIEKIRRRLEFDLYYIDNWSLWLDMRIIIMTFFPPKLEVASPGATSGVLARVQGRVTSFADQKPVNGADQKPAAASDYQAELGRKLGLAADKGPVSAWIEGAEGALTLHRIYLFYVDVGQIYKAALAKTPARKTDWGEYQELDLLVMLSNGDFEVMPRQQRLKLLKSGDAKPVEFAIRPLVENSAVLRISLYLAHGLSLLEEYEISIDVDKVA